MATKRVLTTQDISSEIRVYEKEWFVNSTTINEIKSYLRDKYFVTEVKVDPVTKKERKKYSDDFTATLLSIGKYYGRLKKKPMSTQDILSSQEWDKLKMAVEKLWPEIAGLPIKQGYELIRTKVRTNLKQLQGLPNRLQYWNFKSES